MTNAYFLGGSYDNEQGYRTLAYWGSAIILLTSITFAVGTHRNIPELEVPPTRTKPKLTDIWQEILETLNHKSGWSYSSLALFLASTLVSLPVLASTSIGSSGTGHRRYRHFCDRDLSAALVISVFAGVLAKGWEKRLATWLFIVSIIVGPVLLLGRLSDMYLGTSVMPPNGEQYGMLVGHAHSQCLHGGVGSLGFS